MKKILITAIIATFSITAPAIHFAKKATAQVCFTPGGNCTQSIVNEMTAAQVSLKIQAYSLTNPEILLAIFQAKSRGVAVRVIVDKSQTIKIKNIRSTADYLVAAGIPTWIDDKPSIAHNKVMLIDDDIVITGSFNFSKAAQERNAENLLVIVDRNLYRVYDRNFEKRLKESKKYEQ